MRVGTRERWGRTTSLLRAVAVNKHDKYLSRNAGTSYEHMKLCYTHVLWVLLCTRYEHAHVYMHECDHTFALLLRLMREE